jgi:hypothetical protein
MDGQVDGGHPVPSHGEEGCELESFWSQAFTVRMRSSTFAIARAWNKHPGSRGFSIG